MRLISFGFDSFESEVGGGLVGLDLRFVFGFSESIRKFGF